MMKQYRMRVFAAVFGLFFLSVGLVHAQRQDITDAHTDGVGIQLGISSQPATQPGVELPKAKNVILMISDGCGFNGWLAADYYEGKAGTQPHQVARPDGTRRGCQKS